MAALNRYLTLDHSTLSQVSLLEALNDREHLLIQGSLALLRHQLLYKQKYYSRDDISTIFNAHKYDVTTTHETKTKTVPSSAPSISRFLNLMRESGCIEAEPRRVGIDGSEVLLDTVISFAPLAPYFVKQATKSAKSKKGGRQRKSVMLAIKEAVDKYDNIHFIANDGTPPAIPVTERIITMLYSVSPSREQAVKKDPDGRYMERAQGTFRSRSVGEVLITQTRQTEKDSTLSSAADLDIVLSLLGLVKRAYSVDKAEQMTKQKVDQHGCISISRDGRDIYILDIHRLCLEVGRSYHNTREREPVVSALRRIMSNRWTIKPTERTTSDFNNKFISQSETFYQIVEPVQMVNELLQDDLSGQSIPTERYLSFSLGVWFQQQIQQDTMLRVHDQLKSERSDIAHAIYSLCRGLIGHGDHRKKIQMTLLEFYRTAVNPNIWREDNFLKGLLAFAKRQNEKTLSKDLFDHYYPADKCDAFELTSHKRYADKTIDLSQKSGVFWFCGYFIRLEFNEEISEKLHRRNRTLATYQNYRSPKPLITIWLDENDPVIGANSDRAQRKRRLTGQTDPEHIENDLVAILYSRGVTLKEAEKLVNNHPESFIQVALEYLAEKIHAGEDIRNPGGFLIRVIKDNSETTLLSSLEHLKEKRRKQDMWKESRFDTSWANSNDEQEMNDVTHGNAIDGEFEVVEDPTEEQSAQINETTQNNRAYRHQLKDTFSDSQYVSPLKHLKPRRHKNHIEKSNDHREQLLSFEMRKQLQSIMVDIMQSEPSLSSVDVKAKALDVIDKITGR